MKLRIAVAVASMTVLIIASGCTADSSDPGSAASPAPSEAVNDGSSIPDGVYAKTFTKDHVHDLGLDLLFKDRYSSEGTAMVVYKFEGGFWSESSGPTEDALEPGSQGSHAYDESGNLVITEACCGDTVLTWSLEDDALTLKAIGPDAALDDPMTRLMRDGTYTREG